MADIKNINAGVAVVSIIANDEKLNNVLNESKRNIARFAEICTQIGMKLNGLGQLYMMPIARANEAYVGFQTEMLRVGAVTSSTGDQMAALTEKARELGIVSGFSATQVAAVMGNLGMMGFDNSQIKDTTKDILALSRVCSTDAAEAATIAAPMRATTVQTRCHALGSAGLQTRNFPRRSPDRRPAAQNSRYHAMPCAGECCPRLRRK